VTTYVPLLAIPRADIPLRPELLYIFDQTGIEADDICTLEDISTIDPAQTELFLVDHNVPRGTLAEIYDFKNHPWRKELIQGVIDHREDEKYFDDLRGYMKRYDIQNSGSCSSLVTKWIMGHASPNQISSTAFNGPQILRENPAEAHDIAQLLLSAILVDTVNLTQKVTPNDLVACRFLVEFIPEHNFTTLYDSIQSVKLSIAGMSLQDLLRRDYKEYDTPLGKLGMSTVARKISFLRSHFTDFDGEYRKFVNDRDLKIHLTMTVSGQGDEFERGGMVLTENKNIIESFERKGKEKHGIREIPEKFEDIKDGWNYWVYDQDDVFASRKKIAPLILEILGKDAE
jgi:exopolyphosphatase